MTKRRTDSTEVTKPHFAYTAEAWEHFFSPKKHCPRLLEPIVYGRASHMCIVEPVGPQEHLRHPGVFQINTGTTSAVDREHVVMTDESAWDVGTFEREHKRMVKRNSLVFKQAEAEDGDEGELGDHTLQVVVGAKTAKKMDKGELAELGDMQALALRVDEQNVYGKCKAAAAWGVGFRQL